MNKRLIFAIAIAGIVIIGLVAVWYVRRSINADVTTTESRLPSDTIPQAISFFGQLNVNGGSAGDISVVVNGRATRARADGTFSIAIDRSYFNDDQNILQDSVAVDFWDLDRNIRYQIVDNPEKFLLALPAEWQQLDVVVYGGAPASWTYHPSPAFHINRDFTLEKID